MQVKIIAECSKGSILQYFRPSLSYRLSLKSLFGLFLSRLIQVLLYIRVLDKSSEFDPKDPKSSQGYPLLLERSLVAQW